MKPAKFETKFLHSEQEAYDTRSFYFMRPKGFDYEAGQYIRLVLEDAIGEKDSRYFTLSSAPFEPTLKITVRIKATRYKEALYNLIAGDLVTFYGPIGLFHEATSPTHDYIMLAGGVGVTPFYSMLKQVRHDLTPIRALLLTSYKRENDIVFKDELLEIAGDSGGRIKVWNTLTQPNKKELHQQLGHIQDQWKLVTDEVRRMEDPIFMLAGSENFIIDIYSYLLELGIMREKIYTERFL